MLSFRLLKDEDGTQNKSAVSDPTVGKVVNVLFTY